MKFFKLILIVMLCGSLFSCAKKSSKKSSSNNGNATNQNGQNYQNGNNGYQGQNYQQGQQQAMNQNSIPYYGNNANQGGIIDKIKNIFLPQQNSNSFLMGTAFSILKKLFGINLSTLNTSMTSNATLPGAQFASQFNDPVSQIEIFGADSVGSNCGAQSRIMLLSKGYSNSQYKAMCQQFSSNQVQAGAVKINGACQKLSGQSVFQICDELATVMGY